jgi:para-nitrobenzyl esterase
MMWLAATTCASSPDVPACLRALTPEQLIRAFPVEVSIGTGKQPVSWGPNVDGVVLPLNPLEALRTGVAAPVPVVVGHNTDETNLTMPVVTTEAQYRAFVAAILGPTLAEQVLQRYPVATYGSPRKALVQVTTDATFGCQARMASRAAVIGRPTVPVYRYLFGRAPVALRGAFHGSELPYVFQRAALLTPNPAAEDLTVEAAMLGYWTRFAATGDPNGAGALPWPRVSAVEPLQHLDAALTTSSGWRNDECDFWDLVTGTSVPPPP